MPAAGKHSAIMQHRNVRRRRSDSEYGWKHTWMCVVPSVHVSSKAFCKPPASQKLNNKLEDIHLYSQDECLFLLFTATADRPTVATF
jgi:hypothetical protein